MEQIIKYQGNSYILVEDKDENGNVTGTLTYGKNTLPYEVTAEAIAMGNEEGINQLAEVKKALLVELSNMPD
jgi:hypothetical protein